jgi:hypothetical protein
VRALSPSTNLAPAAARRVDPQLQRVDRKPHRVDRKRHRIERNRLAVNGGRLAVDRKPLLHHETPLRVDGERHSRTRTSLPETREPHVVTPVMLSFDEKPLAVTTTPLAVDEKPHRVTSKRPSRDNGRLRRHDGRRSMTTMTLSSTTMTLCRDTGCPAVTTTSKPAHRSPSVAALEPRDGRLDPPAPFRRLERYVRAGLRVLRRSKGTRTIPSAARSHGQRRAFT